MPYKPLCGHSWEEIQGRDRHFKCEWCGAIGYTRPKLPGAKRDQDRIYVYVCGKKGCHKPAIIVVGTYKACEQHVEGR